MTQALLRQLTQAYSAFHQRTAEPVYSWLSRVNRHTPAFLRLFINHETPEGQMDTIDYIPIGTIRREVADYEAATWFLARFARYIRGFFTGLHQRRHLLVLHDVSRMVYEVSFKLSSEPVALSQDDIRAYQEILTVHRQQGRLRGKLQPLVRLWEAYLTSLSDSLAVLQSDGGEPSGDSMALALSNHTGDTLPAPTLSTLSGWEAVMQDIQRHKLSMGTLESIALPERGPRIDELSRELEAIYRRGVRIVHPDRVVSASEAVRQQADSLCRALNQWHEAQKNTLELLRTHQRLIDVTVEPGIPMGGLSEEDNARLIFKQLNSKIWYVLFRQSCNNPRYQAWSEQRWMRLHDGILEVQREVRERVAAMAAYRAENRAALAENRAALAENQAILDAQGERIAQLMQQFELLADRVPAPATVAASPGTAPSAFFGGAGAAVAAVAAPTTTAISEGKSDDTGSAASAHTGV